MPCYHPIQAYKTTGGEVVFQDRGGVSKFLMLPCGRCIGCKMKRAMDWAIRITNEGKLHPSNCFVTLTYEDNTLPNDRSVSVRTLQLFMKRLRKTIHPIKIRFFACGEYGELLQRPHYHAIIFGHDFPDRKQINSIHSKEPLYESKQLNQAWGLGFATIGKLTPQTAAYVARYATKKINGDRQQAHYEILDPNTGEIHDRKPEFAVQSRRPGIGADWIAKFHADVYADTRYRGQILFKGKKRPAPRYYDKRHRATDPDSWESLRALRLANALNQVGDNTPSRRRAKETVAKAKLKLTKEKLR